MIQLQNCTHLRDSSYHIPHNEISSIQQSASIYRNRSCKSRTRVRYMQAAGVTKQLKVPNFQFYNCCTKIPSRKTNHGIMEPCYVDDWQPAELYEILRRTFKRIFIFPFKLLQINQCVYEWYTQFVFLGLWKKTSWSKNLWKAPAVEWIITVHCVIKSNLITCKILFSVIYHKTW